MKQEQALSLTGHSVYAKGCTTVKSMSNESFIVTLAGYLILQIERWDQRFANLDVVRRQDRHLPFMHRSAPCMSNTFSS